MEPEVIPVLGKPQNREHVVERPSIPLVTQDQLGRSRRGGERFPDVFEHQYAEYILGLKPPYLDLAILSKSEREIKDQGDHPQSNGD